MTAHLYDDAPERIVWCAVERCGGLDLRVNNAGIAIDGAAGVHF